MLYLTVFVATLILLFLYRRTAPRDFGPKANYVVVPGWTDLPYFGLLFYLTTHWETIAVEFLKLTRANQWKTWVARAPKLGALGGGLIMLTSEASVRHVLSTNFNNYVKGKDEAMPLAPPPRLGATIGLSRLGATILSYYHTTSTVTAPDTNLFPTTTNLLPTQPPKQATNFKLGCRNFSATACLPVTAPCGNTTAKSPPTCSAAVCCGIRWPSGTTSGWT